MEGESFSTPFAGLLFITLAAEGRLVLDAGRADELIAGLERTHSSVRTRLSILRQRQAGPAERVVELPDDASRDIVDAVFADQIAPGLLERANEEIPSTSRRCGSPAVRRCPAAGPVRRFPDRRRGRQR